MTATIATRVEVLFVTIFFSLLLSALFFFWFVRATLQRRGKSLEQQSLMPLEQDRVSRKLSSKP